jgi:hypothetical protein
MKTFRVWVRPSDYGFLICVDGVDNAHWLIDQLGRSFVFCSAQPIYCEHASTLCSFQVPCHAQLPLSTLQRLLAAMPQVTLLRAAAAG